MPNALPACPPDAAFDEDEVAIGVAFDDIDDLGLFDDPGYEVG